MYVSWKEKPIIPTRSAYNEMSQLNIDMYDVKEVLSEGYDCPESKRRKGVVERCLRKKDVVFKVVVARDYWRAMNMEVWAIIHVGKFGYRR